MNNPNLYMDVFMCVFWLRGTHTHTHSQCSQCVVVRHLYKRRNEPNRAEQTKAKPQNRFIYNNNNNNNRLGITISCFLSIQMNVTFQVNLFSNLIYSSLVHFGWYLSKGILYDYHQQKWIYERVGIQTAFNFAAKWLS